MSKHVHCPECQSENTPGSKFCNHCGARLPKSTSVLCPRCQFPNPHNNFYCDNCGSRLHPEQNNIAPEEEEPEPEASDLPTSAKMFSLPTRQPGDTGDLDPSSLPDWLKSQSEESEKRKNVDKLPRLSDLTPEERSTAEDLPGWLFDTESDELVISSPDDITTEHFLHLIQDIDEEEREKLSGLLNDPAITGDSANLPDWLKAVAKPKQKEAPTVPDEISPQDQDEIPAWLGEARVPSTALAGKSDTTDDIFADATLFEDNVPDWMSADEQQNESAAPEEAADDFMLDAAAATSLTGWLAEFDEDDEVESEETAASTLPSTSVPPAETAAVETKRSLTDWLTDFEEETPDAPVAKSPAAEAADWLDLDTSTDASLATGETGPLPDWLDDLEPATKTQFDHKELDDTLTDLFGEDPESATGELEWLADANDVEPESTAPPLTPLIGAVGAAALAGNQDDAAAPEEDPDWLSELAAFDPNEMAEIVAEETAVPESRPEPQPDDEAGFDVEGIFETTGAAGLDSFEIDDELLGVDEQTAGDWADIDGILAGTAGDETLPEWLEQLDGAIDSEITLAEDDGAPPEEIPAWVASMRPDDTGELASVLPSALFLDSDASDFLSETSDLADADLPDWLDSSVEHRTATAEKEASGLLGSEEELGDAPAELEAILADLPPAQAPEDMLQKAEIPGWLEDLKPRELTGEAEPLTESRLESSGPLAGMPNTIAIEPIVAMPRAATMLDAYAISAEQTQQARLLRQLAQEGPQPPQTKKPAISARGVTGLRFAVALLLLAAVFLGLYGPAFLKSKTPAVVPIPAAALNTAVANAAGKTVLVAFEYSPALAGELNHEAETLLAQLNAFGSPILTASQYVAGTAVAETMTAPYDVTSFGFVPGEAMGLRQLGGCLGENAPISPCTSLHNLSIHDDLSATLKDVSLIIVLTGERSSLINWVEQVGAVSDVPIVVGATQALEPVVAPYYASAQIDGYLNGLPATVAYQQAYIQVRSSAANDQFGAQSFILLVTAVILLIGGLAFSSAKKKS